MFILTGVTSYCLLSLSATTGVTLPLLTTSSGEKFGKSAGNAVWLSPAKTSPFHLYQHFVQSADQEVHKLLRLFTFLQEEELQEVMHQHEVSKGRCGLVQIYSMMLWLPLVSYIHACPMCMRT